MAESRLKEAAAHAKAAVPRPSTGSPVTTSRGPVLAKKSDVSTVSEAAAEATIRKAATQAIEVGHASHLRQS